MRTLGNITMPAPDRLAVRRAAELLRSQFPISQVILYGSKARGDDAADSDIDLLVLTRRPVAYHEKELMTQVIYPLELELGVVISMLIMSQSKWETGLCGAMPLHAEVLRDGVMA